MVRNRTRKKYGPPTCGDYRLACAFELILS
jgi:hypothetical protein